MVRLKCLLFDTGHSASERVKRTFCFTARDRCSTGRSCSKADKRLTRVSVSFVKEHFFGQFCSVILLSYRRLCMRNKILISSNAK